MNTLLVALLACLSGYSSAAAKGAADGSPKVVGVIADLQGDVRWLPPRKKKPDILDELHPEDSISVGGGASVSLLYYAQCRQELVTGVNVVRIGPKSSSASHENLLTAAKAPCDPPGALLDRDVSPVLGALVLRGAKIGGDDEQKYFDALDHDPGDVGVLISYAAYLDEEGRFDEAERQYAKAQGLRPDSSRVRLRLADTRAGAALSSLESWLASNGKAGHPAEPERPPSLTKDNYARIWPRLAGRAKRLGKIQKLVEAHTGDEGPTGLLVSGDGPAAGDDQAALDLENADRGAILDALSPPADRERLGRLFSEIRGRYR